MATVNGTHAGICRVVVLGGIFPATPIIKALWNAGIEVHVIHPRTPVSALKGVNYHESDISAESLKPIFSEIKPDLIISTTSGGSFETQKGIIDTAIDAEVSRFIPYEFGQDSLNEKVQERLPPSRERARTIDYLKQQAADGRISWVAIATGTDLDRGLLNGNLGFDIKWQSATINGKGGEHFAGSSSAWIGRVVLSVIKQWLLVQNQYLYAAELITSGDDVVACFEKVTEKSFVASHSDVEDCVREAEQRIERGFPDAGMFLMARSILYDESIGAVRPFEENDAKQKLELKGESLDGVIEWVVHEQRHHNQGGCGCD